MKYKKINSRLIICHMEAKEFKERGLDIYDIIKGSEKAKKLYEDLELQVICNLDNWLRPGYGIYPVEFTGLTDGSFTFAFIQKKQRRNRRGI